MAEVSARVSPMRHASKLLIALAATGVLLAACSGSSSDDDRGGNSDITSNPGASVDPASSTPAETTVSTQEVVALPFNASGLLAGNANPDFPSGTPGEVSVVATGPFKKGDYDESVLLTVAFRNNTAEAIAHVDLSATARDGAGALIATGSSHGTEPAQVAPGEVGMGYIYFESVGKIPDTGLDFDFAVETSPADTSSFNTAPVKVIEATHTGKAIIGTATNETEETITSPYSVTAFCFKGDEILGYVDSFADQDADLEPGGTVSFTIDLEYTDIECDEFAVGSSGWFN